ncbi:GntR family transcriptional regulator [Streptomyces sp. NPDC018045]|uniref:GntR family transcriptional regulator n=1 Tax=Streptomyces sp. NPDC018045 TaxID=3365037 RepID=UPI0037BA9D84
MKATTMYAPADDDGIDLRALRGDIKLTAHVTRLRAPAAVARNTELLHEAARTWWPVAQRCRQAAVGSPADQRRWDQLLKGADPGRAVKASFTELTVLAGAVRELLRAIEATTLEWPSVCEIAHRIEDALHNETYPVGSPVAVSTVATALEVPVELVKLALSDLAESGLLERRGQRLFVVGNEQVCREQTQFVTERLRAQIAYGVYPPGTLLPSAPELAAAFVTNLTPVRAALHHLAAERLVRLRKNAPAIVLEAARRLPSPARHAPDQRHASHPQVYDHEAITAAARAGREQWRRHPRLSPEDVTAQWERLRAMARQMLGTLEPSRSPFRHRRDTALIRAAELESAPLPEAPEPRRWHTACLATAVAALLPYTRGHLPVTHAPAAHQVPPRGPQGCGAMGPYTADDFVLDLRDAEVPGTAGAFAFFFGDDPDARTFT